jgi:hypothetical protein
MLTNRSVSLLAVAVLFLTANTSLMSASHHLAGVASWTLGILRVGPQIAVSGHQVGGDCGCNLAVGDDCNIAQPLNGHNCGDAMEDGLCMLDVACCAKTILDTEGSCENEVDASTSSCAGSPQVCIVVIDQTCHTGE